MKTSAVLLVLGLLSPGAVFAQAPLPEAASSFRDFAVAPPALPCSIADMHVRQGGSLQALRTEDGQSRPILTPTLTLTPRNGRAILSATVTAHGYPATPGTSLLVNQPADKNHRPQRRDLATTLQVSMKPSGNGSFAGELQLTGLAVVTSVDLKSVTYADGTTWKAPSKPECSVEPDPLLLISAR